VIRTRHLYSAQRGTPRPRTIDCRVVPPLVRTVPRPLPGGGRTSQGSEHDRPRRIRRRCRVMRPPTTCKTRQPAAAAASRAGLRAYVASNLTRPRHDAGACWVMHHHLRWPVHPVGGSGKPPVPLLNGQLTFFPTKRKALRRASERPSAPPRRRRRHQPSRRRAARAATTASSSRRARGSRLRRTRLCPPAGSGRPPW
jgi:hypothetical protein